MYLPHNKLVFGGPLGGATGNLDEWSVSLNVGYFDDTNPPGKKPTTDMPYAETVGVPEALQPAILAFMATSAMNWNAYTSFIKFNALAPNGSYLYPDSNTRDITPVRAGLASGTNYGPWQVTQCVTLRTQRPRGVGHASRFFPPTNIAVEANSPYIAAVSATALANNTVTLIRAINALTIGGRQPLRVITAPDRPTVAASIAAFETVIRVGVDRTPDTQRRRTNRVPRSEYLTPGVIPFP